MKKTEQRRRMKGYGNSQNYLIARLKRDRPDIMDEFSLRLENSPGVPNLRALAREMGYLPNPDPQDKILEEMLKLWGKADEDTKALFDFFRDEPAETPRKGPAPDPFSENAPADLVALSQTMTLSQVARELGVSRETVRRWSTGESKPRPKTLNEMATLLKEQSSRQTPEQR